MNMKKAYTYTVKEEIIAKYAKALAHPARVAILNLLLKKETCVCGYLVEELPLSQSTVSQHLKALKLAGLIKGEIEGASICYCIDIKEWNRAKITLSDLFACINDKKDVCC